MRVGPCIIARRYTYAKGVCRLSASSCVTEIGHGGAARTGSFEGQAFLFETDADGFRADKHVQEEVFGAASVMVRCADLNTMRDLLEEMEGQLTATLQLDVPADLEHARSLLPTLERKVGRILANGWPTGVEVGHAMVHGGRIRRPATAAAPRSARWRSDASCGPSATRTCRWACSRNLYRIRTRSAYGGG